MVGKLRKENYSRDEREFIVHYVSANRSILEDKSNNEQIYLKKRDKWRDLTEKLKGYGVVRYWKEVRSAYQRWKVSAKKSIAAFRKSGDKNIPMGLHGPTDIDYIIYNICPQDFEDIEENDPLNGCENNPITNEDELSNVSHSLVTTSESRHNTAFVSQFTEKSTEFKDEEFIDSKTLIIKPRLYAEEENIEESTNTCKETRDDIPQWQNLNVPANLDVACISEELSSNIEPMYKKQRTSSDNDHETFMYKGISKATDDSNEFKKQENMLKLSILRAQLSREEEESKIRMKQEEIKLIILKLQLKREKILLKNVLNSS